MRQWRLAFLAFALAALTLAVVRPPGTRRRASAPWRSSISDRGASAPDPGSRSVARSVVQVVVGPTGLAVLIVLLILAAILGFTVFPRSVPAVVWRIVEGREIPWWLVGLGIVGLALILWRVPIHQVAAAKDLKPEARFGAVQESRKTLAQILGGALILVTFYQTWTNTRVAQEGQITTRFGQAITQLGATQADKSGATTPQFELRVGAIYALERIGRDSSPDYFSSLEILSTYARRNAARPAAANEASPGEDLAPWYCVDRPLGQSRPRDDVQAILFVVGRRQGPVEDAYVDLSSTSLRGACLYIGNLQRVSFAGADLRQAVITGANLRAADFEQALLDRARLSNAGVSRAWFGGASLQSASLDGVWAEPVSALERAEGRISTVSFEKADLRNADLTRARLGGADFGEGARLEGTSLKGADLRHAAMKGSNLSSADLRGADLSRANLSGAELGAWFDGANLTGTDLRGANLTEAAGLTSEQISAAIIDGATRLPAQLASWERAEPPVRRERDRKL